MTASMNGVGGVAGEPVGQDLAALGGGECWHLVTPVGQTSHLSAAEQSS